MGQTSVMAMSEDVHSQRPKDQPTSVKPLVREVLSWRSDQLLGEASEARIVHGDEVYRLLRTRNGKLILVK
jgi:hemin uptake protein HemP